MKVLNTDSFGLDAITRGHSMSPDVGKRFVGFALGSDSDHDLVKIANRYVVRIGNVFPLLVNEGQIDVTPVRHINSVALSGSEVRRQDKLELYAFETYEEMAAHCVTHRNPTTLYGKSYTTTAEYVPGEGSREGQLILPTMGRPKATFYISNGSGGSTYYKIEGRRWVTGAGVGAGTFIAYTVVSETSVALSTVAVVNVGGDDNWEDYDQLVLLLKQNSASAVVGIHAIADGEMFF